jgi:hypothetical protein
MSRNCFNNVAMVVKEVDPQGEIAPYFPELGLGEK